MQTKARVRSQGGRDAEAFGAQVEKVTQGLPPRPPGQPVSLEEELAPMPLAGRRLHLYDGRWLCVEASGGHARPSSARPQAAAARPVELPAAAIAPEDR